MYREKINEAKVISETTVYLTHFLVNMLISGFPTANISTAQFIIIHEALLGFVPVEVITNAISENNSNNNPCTSGLFEIISLRLNELFTVKETQKFALSSK